MWSKYIDIKSGTTGISGAFCAYGSFGIVDGRDCDLEKYTETKDGYQAEYSDFRVETVFETHENDVCVRKDVLVAKNDLILNKYASRFLLEGGEYEVYTQYSSWMHESVGNWQKLSTSVEVSNLGIRSTEGGTPMAAIRNKGNNRLFVIHLIPNSAWKIKISRVPVDGKNEGVLIEAGISENGLNMACKKGEKIDMPEIIFYTSQNSIDFDAWKLHVLYNKMYPRKQLPVLYNTWMYTFDKIDVEDILRQADCAAELGIEMFLIDAGWFGEAEDWYRAIGVWTENLNGGFRGRLKEVSEYVQSKGMTFGMWIEPERALSNTSIAKEHPEYFLSGSHGDMFLDFAREDAREYIFEVLCNIIDTYKLGFMKFDFNAPLAYDETGSSFYRYIKGQRQLIGRLKEKYPSLYITNCASGGTRMDMGQQTVFDSIWMSDNQGPIEGLRIFKDTALRMPPCNMEKWDVRKFCDGILKYGSFEKATLPISCDCSVWEMAQIVKPRFTYGFIQGGVMGFSADIASYPDEEKTALKKLVADYKADRDFYKNAVMRILYDTPSITALQYSDIELKRVIIHIFTKYSYQKTLTVYPVFDKTKKYADADGSRINPDAEITVNVSDSNDCIMLEFNAEV